MAVIVNVKPSKDVPPKQKQAWGEFLEMILARAEAELEREKGSPGDAE